MPKKSRGVKKGSVLSFVSRPTGEIPSQKLIRGYNYHRLRSVKQTHGIGKKATEQIQLWAYLKTTQRIGQVS